MLAGVDQIACEKVASTYVLLRIPENALPTRSINVSVTGQDQRAAVLCRAVSALLVFEVSGGGFGAADL